MLPPPPRPIPTSHDKRSERMSRLALQHYTSKATDAPPPAANTVLFCSTEIALISDILYFSICIFSRIFISFFISNFTRLYLFFVFHMLHCWLCRASHHSCSSGISLRLLLIPQKTPHDDDDDDDDDDPLSSYFISANLGIYWKRLWIRLLSILLEIIIDCKTIPIVSSRWDEPKIIVDNSILQQ